MDPERLKKPFSKRFGYRSQPKEIAVWEDAPENLRHFVLQTVREIGYGPSDIRNLIWRVADPFVLNCLLPSIIEARVGNTTPLVTD
jgi:hypothetical protein